MKSKTRAGDRPCICEHIVLGQPQKSSDVKTRRIRNPACPLHGRADERAIRKRDDAIRKRDEAVRTGGWR